MPEFNVMNGNDEGTYYAVRNLGVGEDRRCAWFGLARNGRWANVFFGSLVSEGQLVVGMRGTWCDVPWAPAAGHGQISVEFASTRREQWRRIEVSGGFGGSGWFEAESVTPLPAPPAGKRDFPVDVLTGVWMTDTGAFYYARELPDRTVFWFAVRPDLAATHVARGTRTGENVAMHWLDIPPGRARGGGSLHLRIPTPGIMTKQRSSAAFGSSRWLKLS